jgi:thymidylate kinase
MSIACQSMHLATLSTSRSIFGKPGSANSGWMEPCFSQIRRQRQSAQDCHSPKKTSKMKHSGSRGPFKILFAGIDGSGKSTCLDFLIDKLDRQYRIVKIGPSGPFLYCNGTKKKMFDNFLYSPAGFAAAFYENRYSRGVFIAFRFLCNLIVAQYLKFRPEADLIMHESDTLLHPAVYITYYVSWAKRLSAGARFSLVHRIFGPRKNFVIFYLAADADTAMERIKRRDTTFHRHENVHDLKILKTELDAVVNVALEKGVEIVKIDTNGRSQESVCEEIAGIVEQRLLRNYN